jgi:hypothetical protein
LTNGIDIVKLYKSLFINNYSWMYVGIFWFGPLVNSPYVGYGSWIGVGVGVVIVDPNRPRGVSGVGVAVGIGLGLGVGPGSGTHDLAIIPSTQSLRT